MDHEFEITVKATATASSISDVIMSGPLNIKKTKTTSGMYLITWTPTKANLGQYFPVCFVAEGQSGYRIYQSEMRCVIVEVKPASRTAHVTCTQSTMSVAVERSVIDGLHGAHLQLNDPHCPLQTNATHVYANIPLNTCDTVVEEDNDNLIFTNEIVSFDNKDHIITRKILVDIEFSCKYHKRNNVTIEFDAKRPIQNFSDRGFGEFSYEFDFYESVNFATVKSQSSYPLEYYVGDPIYLQIRSTSAVPDTELFLESCRAMPYDNPDYPVSYSIIENGCAVDETVQFYSSRQQVSRFSIDAFKFIGRHDQVFITCSVILCKRGDPNTRCAQGCTNAMTTTPVNHHVHRREAPSQTARHYISQGPLRLKRSKGGLDAVRNDMNMGSKLNMNLVFVVGCLSVVIGLVCGVLMFRSRGSTIKYQPLPTSDC